MLNTATRSGQSSGGTLYQMQESVPVLQDNAEIPGAARVMACGVNGVVLEDGDVYGLDNGKLVSQGQLCGPHARAKDDLGRGL